MTLGPDPSGRRLFQGDVIEHSLPGIGHRYEMTTEDGAHVVVVIHHSGRRDLYMLEPGETEPQAAAELSDAQARTLGAILGGAYFKPAVAEEIEAVIGSLLIDWLTLPDGAPAVGRTIADLEVRRRTRMTVAAIVRGREHLITPDPNERLRGGDRLVVLGRQQDLPALRRLLLEAAGG